MLTLMAKIVSLLQPIMNISENNGKDLLDFKVTEKLTPYIFREGGLYLGLSYCSHHTTWIDCFYYLCH